MAVLGDRSLASLLSALAEAPDFNAAASFLLAELKELTSTRRVCMLRVDGAEQNLTLSASLGFDPELALFSISLGDLSSPLVVATRSLTSARGQARLSPRSLGVLPSWTLIPMSQPRFRGAPDVIANERAAELLRSADAMLVQTQEAPIRQRAGRRHRARGSAQGPTFR
jgi:hypothetical protein